MRLCTVMSDPRNHKNVAERLHIMMTMMLTMLARFIQAINVKLQKRRLFVNTWPGMLAYVSCGLPPYLLSFQQEGTFSINGETEAFGVNTHLRSLERGSIIKILTGNNTNCERVRQACSSFFNFGKI